VSDDLRSVLEGIAYGTDEKITPADRLRAVEQLRELAPSLSVSATEREIMEWDDATLDREWDEACAEEIVESVRSGEGRYPNLASLLGVMVEERAREIADADQIEAEIERRATDRARWLLEREIGTQPTTQTTNPTLDPVDGDTNVVRRQVPPPPGVEPAAGFRRRRGLRRLGER
jgi:hypothetical protein